MGWQYTKEGKADKEVIKGIFQLDNNNNFKDDDNEKMDDDVDGEESEKTEDDSGIR